MGADTSTMGRSVRAAILGLGVTQVIGWGSTYYLLSLLAGQIGQDLGMTSAWVLGGTSLTLICAALIGPMVGRWQDKSGSRIVMVTGSLITAAGLGLLSIAHSAPLYYLSWLVIGVGAPMSLYSAAFTALTQVAGPHARRAISYLTFMGGLASTIFWPLTSALIPHFDWRGITLIYAGLNLLICLPLHALCLGGPAEAQTGENKTDMIEGGIPESAHLVAFLLFAVMLALNGLIFNSWSLLVFSVLEGIGFLPAAAILVGSLVGVFQVAGRMGEMVMGGRYPVMWTALISAICLPVAFGVLMQSGGHVMIGGLFAMLYGVSNGLLTIARGGLTLAIFGARGYGERINKITVGQNAAGAIAPIIGGYLLDKAGAPWLVTAMFATATLSLGVMLVLRQHCFKNGLR